MKATFKFLTSTTLCFVLLLLSCEKIPDFTKETDPPVIYSFSPLSGQAGDDITITGDNLQYIDSVWVGEGLSKVKYKLSANSMVITLSTASRPGKIKLSGKGGAVFSTGTFTLHFMVPTLKDVPLSGRVKEEIEIVGENMDAVTKVFIADKEAPILLQKRGDMIVRVPFDESPQQPIRFEYFDGSHNQQVKSGHDFEVITEIPFIYNSPTMGTIGLTYSVVGKNLMNVDSVIIGGHPARIIKQNNDTLLFNMPIRHFKTAGTYPAKLVYYATEFKEMTASFSISLPDPSSAWHRWDDVYISGHTGNQSFIDGETGTAYSNEEFALTPSYWKEIDFIGYYSSSNAAIMLYGKHAASASSVLKNYKVGSKTILDLAPGLDIEVNKDRTPLRVLSDANSTQADLIQKVHTHTLSADDIALAMSVTAPSSNSIRPNGNPIWGVGSVIMVANETTGKRGLFHVKEIIGMPDLAGKCSLLVDMYWMK